MHWPACSVICIRVRVRVCSSECECKRNVSACEMSSLTLFHFGHSRNTRSNAEWRLRVAFTVFDLLVCVCVCVRAALRLDKALPRDSVWQFSVARFACSSHSKCLYARYIPVAFATVHLAFACCNLSCCATGQDVLPLLTFTLTGNLHLPLVILIKHIVKFCNSGFFRFMSIIVCTHSFLHLEFSHLFC